MLLSIGGSTIPPPTLRRYARYHLFAPVLIAGPIHRLPNFERTLERRRWDAKEFYSGAERALVGAFLAFFVAEYLYAQLLQELAPFNLDQNFSGRIVQSAIDWVFLYIAFSGLTDLALGLSAMMGLKLEENFNRPYLARDLIDFWQRWHMTLSHWCRDYIYVLITSRFRSPVLGIFSAMVILGIWHETSIYYLLWAFWQALGIVLVHVLYRQSATISKPFIGAIARAGSFLWLILSQPVCMGLIEVFT